MSDKKPPKTPGNDGPNAIERDFLGTLAAVLGVGIAPEKKPSLEEIISTALRDDPQRLDAVMAAVPGLTEKLLVHPRVYEHIRASTLNLTRLNHQELIASNASLREELATRETAYEIAEINFNAGMERTKKLTEDLKQLQDSTKQQLNRLPLYIGGTAAVAGLVGLGVGFGIASSLSERPEAPSALNRPTIQRQAEVDPRNTAQAGARKAVFLGKRIAGARHT